MICLKCGHTLEEDDAVFCPLCGTKVQAASAPEEAMYGMECTQNDRAGAVQYKAPVQTGSTEAEYKAAPAADIAKPAKEKEYFGGGALALCLVVIGILAVSTGIFACLYFSAIGAL